jgi:single-strand DNA-binding protein
MVTLNAVHLIGRLTRDPDVSITQAGQTVALFSVAVDRRFKNKQGEKETDFFNCKAWSATATFCQKYLKKGQMIVLSGELRQEKWADKDGTRREKIQIIVDQLNMIGSLRRNESGEPDSVETPASMEEPSGSNHDSDLPF